MSGLQRYQPLRSVPPVQAEVIDFAAARAAALARQDKIARRRADRAELASLAQALHPAVRSMLTVPVTPIRNDPPPAALIIMWARFDGPRCAACGKPCPLGSWRSGQHRIPREAGGHWLSNLIGMCGSATSDGCHRKAEDRTREMHDWGFWIGAEEHRDPLLVPVHVLFPDGRRPVWLDNAGGWSFCPPLPGDAA